jgi:MAD (mothers against decapentaplegic) family protein 4
MLFMWNKNCHFLLDLSGLTLQSGPSRIVKDEYTPGPVVGATMDIDGGDIGTIQHHPTHVAGGGYSIPQHVSGTHLG